MAMRSVQPDFDNPAPQRPRFCSTEHLSPELSQLCDEDWPNSAGQETDRSAVDKALHALKWFK